MTLLASSVVWADVLAAVAALTCLLALVVCGRELWRAGRTDDPNRPRPSAENQD